MTRSRVLAALCVAALAPIAPLSLAAPAHADESYTGQITVSDPTKPYYPPETAADQCGTSGDLVTLNYDVVAFKSKSNGPRRFALSTDGSFNGALFIYRNGRCVAADYLGDGAEEQEAMVSDIDGLKLRKGDRVRVEIASNIGDIWRLDIEQPGTANKSAAGKAKRYVKLPYQIGCDAKRAKVTFTKLAPRVKSAVFTSGGKRVGKTRRVNRGQSLTLKKVPANAASIKAVIRLKGGGKAKAARPYSAC